MNYRAAKPARASEDYATCPKNGTEGEGHLLHAIFTIAFNILLTFFGKSSTSLNSFGEIFDFVGLFYHFLNQLN